MASYLYLLKTGRHFKIGIASDLAKRVSNIRVSCPTYLRLICAFEYGDDRIARMAERACHEALDDTPGVMRRGEWFSGDFRAILHTFYHFGDEGVEEDCEVSTYTDIYRESADNYTPVFGHYRYQPGPGYYSHG